MINNPWAALRDFKDEVKRSRRFIFSDKVNQFLGKVRIALPNRLRSFPNGTVLFRSQVGYTEHYYEDYFEYCGYQVERMKPLREGSVEGRSNSKGIPVLYLSSDETTSMSELRPQVGQIISCGRFVTNRELKLVDCCSFAKAYSEAQLIFSEPTTDEEWNDQLWFQINRIFSQPVVNELNNALYVPTQILSELFKDEGFDGLYFKSHLGAGNNFVIFEPAYVDMENCKLKYTEKVEFCFEEFDQRQHT